MPSTPRFHVTQDAAFVYVHVHVPYVRVSEMEYHIEGTHFTFYCKPYLLKLHFPHQVVDNELAKAVYDPNKDNGTIMVHLPKEEPGVEFPDLDLLTKLLQPKKTPQVDLRAASAPAPLIEVLDSTESAESATESTACTDIGVSSGDATLLELEKRFASVADAEDESYDVRVTGDLKVTYGFNNGYSDVFRGWHGEASEIVSLPNPDETRAADRKKLREIGEDTHFDIERYLLDYANAGDDEYYSMAIKYVPHWTSCTVLAAAAQPQKSTVSKTPLIQEVNVSTDAITEQLNSLDVSSGSPASTPIEFSEADRELLQRLPNKEFLIPRGSREELSIRGGLVDILIGYVYEQLTSQGDSGIESPWTISIISPTLAWLDSQTDVAAIIRSGVRRMLAFPLLRQYELATRVVHETAELLRRGKRVVLRSLLDVYRIVEKSETQYLLNAIYIQDYCIWIQSVSDEELARLGEAVLTSLATFKKADTGWALEEMEHQLYAYDQDDSESSETSSDEDSKGDDDDGDDGESEDEGSSSDDEAEEANMPLHPGR